MKNRFTQFGADTSKNPDKYGKCVNRQKRLERQLANANGHTPHIMRMIEKNVHRIQQLAGMLPTTRWQIPERRNGHHRRKKTTHHTNHGPYDTMYKLDDDEYMKWYSAAAEPSAPALPGGLNGYAGPIIDFETQLMVRDNERTREIEEFADQSVKNHTSIITILAREELHWLLADHDDQIRRAEELLSELGF